MSMVCSAYGSDHRKIKRKILTLSLFDFLFITGSLAFIIFQLLSVGLLYDNDNDNNDGNSTTAISDTTTPTPNSLLALANESSILNCTSADENCEKDENDNDNEYRTVIGARISLSIQLIIYLAQLAFGFLLFIAAYHNDSRNLHLWVLFSEVMVVVLLASLFITFFGNFVWVVVILEGVYIFFKVILIRLVRRFIHVNDLALTQFGSLGEFD